MLTGAAWNVVARIGQQVIQFGLSVVLARLLSPEDFGTIGMIMVFTGFAGLFVDLGFGSALVQRRDLEERHISTSFLFSILLGALISVIFIGTAPLIAQFYDLPILRLLTQVLALNFLLIPFGMVPAALLQREMHFKQLARIELFSAVTGGAIAITLSFTGWGIWALAVQSLVVSLISVALKWRVSGWRLRLHFDFAALRDLWGFTINLFGFNFINYWARNADNLLIGRLLGSASLGLYSRAYGLMLLPISQVISLISGVMFPALSSIQDDKPRVKRIYLDTIGLLSLITFPMMIGLLVVSEPFILLVYGERWMGVIVPLRILCMIGLLQSVVNPVGWIYTSQGQTRWMFWWGIFGAGFLIVSILIGISFGSVESVALAYAVGNVIIFYPAIAIPGRLIEMRFSEFLKTIAPQLTASLLMGLFVAGLVTIVSAYWTSAVTVSMSFFCGGIVYAVLLYLLKSPSLYRALDLFGSRIPLRLRRKFRMV